MHIQARPTNAPPISALRVGREATGGGRPLDSVSVLEEFAPALYSADGPVVSFFGFAYSTRMALIRLADGNLWVWSPVALTDALADAVQAIGPVGYIVAPNKLHHLFLHQWVERWPDARLYAPPGLARKLPKLRFCAELGNEPSAPWEAEIDQAVFRGSLFMDEVAFFHRGSRTAIIGDLIQRHSESGMSGWKGIVMRLDGLVGEHGGTPRDWRASFLSRRRARAARSKVLAWNAERLLIAHGQCAQARATEIIEEALSWM